MESFLEDTYPQSFLYGITIRSPIAKGYLTFIEYPKLPGNFFLITARNIPGENKLFNTEMPILADSNLSYIGEPIALMLGPDRTKLEELASQCIISIDTEEAVFDIDENNNQIIASREIVVGNPQEAFNGAHSIVRGSYSSGIQEHFYAEPTGAICWFEHIRSGEKKKILVVKTATQWPYHVKNSVANVLGIPLSEIRVEPALINLHMDGKLIFPSYLSCHAALGTFLTRKPVRFILDREEDFLYSPKRCKTHTSVSTALDDKGLILGAEINISVNLGAYGVNTDEILDQTCLGALGYYNYKNFKLNAKIKRTNIPVQGSCNGFGLSQGSFAMERHVSHIAQSLGMVPGEWRRKIISEGAILLSGFSHKDEASVNDLIIKSAKMSDYYRKQASFELLHRSSQETLRGIGISTGFQGRGLLYPENYGIEVTLTKEGKLEIKTSIIMTDNSLVSIWASIASDILGLEADMVQVITKDAPDSGPSCASRNITDLTRLVEKSCNTIRKMRFRDPLPITVRRSLKLKNGALWEGRLQAAEGKVLDTTGFQSPSWAACVVELTIDPVEYIPQIRGVWFAVDAGRIMSPQRAKQCLRYSITQALGWAFTENIDYVNGKLSADQYKNYAIPRLFDIPPIHIEFINSDTGDPKGIGELPFTCLPTAFLQAASQAVDYQFDAIPVTRENIREQIKSRKLPK
jgi:CO/xanthine dehydrogenase Mo-binding subunit